MVMSTPIAFETPPSQQRRAAVRSALCGVAALLSPGLPMKHRPGMQSFSSPSSSSSESTALVFFLLRAAVQGLCLRRLKAAPAAIEGPRPSPLLLPLPPKSLPAGVSGVGLIIIRLLRSPRGPGTCWCCWSILKDRARRQMRAQQRRCFSCAQQFCSTNSLLGWYDVCVR